MSVTAARGFRAAGVTAGLKVSGRSDLAIVVNDGPSQVAAGVFTTNRFCAAPVQWSRRVLQAGKARAVVINSGCANACTGDQGTADAKAMAQQLASGLGVDAEDILVCSTGLIGEPLPLPKVLAGIDDALKSAHIAGGEAAAKAIMTTDTISKEATARGEGFRVGGMAKGVGMLNPALATMLVVLTTDAVISSANAQAALSQAVEQTFNRLDSDGCMSTNDSVIVMSSGASGVEPELADFTAILQQVCADLAGQLIGDAEGASHDVAVTVRGATSEVAALAVARAITSSNLVKAAIFGNDPNWGRILAAMGTVPQAIAPFAPEQVDVVFNGVCVARSGGIGDSRELVDLAVRQVNIEVDLHAGLAQATVWTNDLTYDYVRENSEYST